MQIFTLSDLGVFLGVLGGILTTLLLTIQKSKCKHVSRSRCAPDTAAGGHSALAAPRRVASLHGHSAQYLIEPGLDGCAAHAAPQRPLYRATSDVD